jgi:hypothetical protein
MTAPLGPHRSDGPCYRDKHGSIVWAFSKHRSKNKNKEKTKKIISPRLTTTFSRRFRDAGNQWIPLRATSPWQWEGINKQLVLTKILQEVNTLLLTCDEPLVGTRTRCAELHARICRTDTESITLDAFSSTYASVYGRLPTQVTSLKDSAKKWVSTRAKSVQSWKSVDRAMVLSQTLQSKLRYRIASLITSSKYRGFTSARRDNLRGTSHRDSTSACHVEVYDTSLEDTEYTDHDDCHADMSTEMKQFDNNTSGSLASTCHDTQVHHHHHHHHSSSSSSSSSSKSALPLSTCAGAGTRHSGITMTRASPSGAKYSRENVINRLIIAGKLLKDMGQYDAAEAVLLSVIDAKPISETWAWQESCGGKLARRNAHGWSKALHRRQLGLRRRLEVYQDIVMLKSSPTRQDARRHSHSQSHSDHACRESHANGGLLSRSKSAGGTYMRELLRPKTVSHDDADDQRRDGVLSRSRSTRDRATSSQMRVRTCDVVCDRDRDRDREIDRDRDREIDRDRNRDCDAANIHTCAASKASECMCRVSDSESEAHSNNKNNSCVSDSDLATLASKDCKFRVSDSESEAQSNNNNCDSDLVILFRELCNVTTEHSAFVFREILTCQDYLDGIERVQLEES